MDFADSTLVFMRVARKLLLMCVARKLLLMHVARN
jgi:hypothetical protein